MEVQLSPAAFYFFSNNYPIPAVDISWAFKTFLKQQREICEKPLKACEGFHSRLLAELWMLSNVTLEH